MTKTAHDPQAYRDVEFCYLTTTGRVSGKPHEIEIWFACHPEPTSRVLYMMAGGRDRADWVRNLRHEPAVSVRIGDTILAATAQIIAPDEPDEQLARELLCDKYQDWRSGQPLSDWGRTALPVRFVL